MASIPQPPLEFTSRQFLTPRHTTHYWECGPANGPLMIFVHGWPEIGLIWRSQIQAFSADGWRCIAPDLRGYGGSSTPSAPSAYSVEEIVADMVELHDYLGAAPAIWVGHDLGSPVAGALAAHFPERARGIVLMSVPYLPETFALPVLLPLVNRKAYPIAEYPDGQFDYLRFYLTHFEQSVADFDADRRASLAAIFRSGDPASATKLYRSALITRNGGWFGAAHRAPAVAPDPALWPAADFAALVAAFETTGFRPGNSWYLNDTANITYAHTARNGAGPAQPVLFLNGNWDAICDINRSGIGEPMLATCQNLSITHLPAGHWLPLERKAETVQAIRAWLESNRLITSV